jgi:hypothetical protein
MLTSSRDAALHSAAQLGGEGYEANISIRGDFYILHIEYGEGVGEGVDEAAVITLPRSATVGRAARSSNLRAVGTGAIRRPGYRTPAIWSSSR